MSDDKVRPRWRVERTKTKLRWVAWRLGSKRKTGRVFMDWSCAVEFANFSAYLDRKFGVVKL